MFEPFMDLQNNKKINNDINHDQNIYEPEEEVEAVVDMEEGEEETNGI